MTEVHGCLTNHLASNMMFLKRNPKSPNDPLVPCAPKKLAYKSNQQQQKINSSHYYYCNSQLFSAPLPSTGFQSLLVKYPEGKRHLCCICGCVLHLLTDQVWEISTGKVSVPLQSCNENRRNSSLLPKICPLGALSRPRWIAGEIFMKAFPKQCQWPWLAGNIS